MAANLDNLEYKKSWHSFYVDYYEGYSPNMDSFHMHEYYEISLIISGNVKVLLANGASEGVGCRIVLTAPNTPHFIACEQNELYRRLNILFAPDFIETYSSEFKALPGIFGKNGQIVSVTEEQCAEYLSIAERMRTETSPTRKKLLLLYLLSLISELTQEDLSTEAPAYITDALSFINEHFGEKIIAEELAWRLGIGRTTLMTNFKSYTGSTLADYILRCRLRHAIEMLKAGATEQTTAESCGFTDPCTLIRSFKKVFNMTPAQYVNSKRK